MEQLLTKDYEDAKNIIGHKLIHNGVQILNLSTQLTTSKTIKKYYKWKFQIIGAKDSFWKHITYDVFYIMYMIYWIYYLIESDLETLTHLGILQARSGSNTPQDR